MPSSFLAIASAFSLLSTPLLAKQDGVNLANILGADGLKPVTVEDLIKQDPNVFRPLQTVVPNIVSSDRKVPANASSAPSSTAKEKSNSVPTETTAASPKGGNP